MECSWPGSSVHGIFQVRGLEWDANAFSFPTTLAFGKYKSDPFFYVFVFEVQWPATLLVPGAYSIDLIFLY